MSSRFIVLAALIFFLAAGILAALAGLSSGSSKAKTTTTKIKVTLPNTTSTVTVTEVKPTRGSGPAGEHALTRIRTVAGPTIFRTSTVTQNKTSTIFQTKTVPVNHTVTQVVTTPGHTETVVENRTVTVQGPTVTVPGPTVTVTVNNGNGNGPPPCTPPPKC